MTPSILRLLRKDSRVEKKSILISIAPLDNCLTWVLSSVVSLKCFLVLLLQLGYVLVKFLANLDRILKTKAYTKLVSNLFVNILSLLQIPLRVNQYEGSILRFQSLYKLVACLGLQQVSKHWVTVSTFSLDCRFLTIFKTLECLIIFVLLHVDYCSKFL